jgi:plastocyanin
MSRRQVATVILGAVLVVGGCSSTGGAGSSSTAACRETTDAGAVTVSIKDFEFAPSAIVARVGQVVAFTNKGFEPHNATLDTGGCATSTLQTDKTDGLVFSAVGVYPFHCSVHAQMTATVTVGA